VKTPVQEGLHRITETKRTELFKAFSEEDHAFISNALWRKAADVRGASRLPEYCEAMPGIVQRAKEAHDFWWECRQAYIDKYGSMP
jgi:hypothetical protein